MRKIKISKWKAKDAEGKDREETLITALEVLIANKKPEEMPRGMDKCRLDNRLLKAFDKANKSGTLELEEYDYKFLKDTIEKDVPSVWGFNQNIFDALEAFLNAKEE